jgi:hypothetical protein
MVSISNYFEFQKFQTHSPKPILKNKKMILQLPSDHRFLKKSLLKFCMYLLLSLPLPRAFLHQSLTVLTRQPRQAAYAINQPIFLAVYANSEHCVDS